MKCTIEKYLQHWRDEPGVKTLVIRGARNKANMLKTILFDQGIQQSAVILRGGKVDSFQTVLRD